MKAHMKRICFITAILCATNAHAGKIYWRTALTGSAVALDALSKTAATPGVPLATGDTAIVIVPSGQAYTYSFDAANTSDESAPAIIAPDDAGATGRWLRVPSFLLPSDIAGLATVATTGSYNDLTNKPTIPATVSQLTNDSGFITTDTKWDGGATGLNATTGRASLELGTAAQSAATDFATAGQGAKADTAVQPGALHPAATGTDGVSVTGQVIANTDKGSTAVTAHNSAFTHGDIAHTNRTALDAVSGTNTGDQTSVSGNAGGLAAQYVDWAASTGGASIANKPTIPTDTNQLTNGAGYISGFTETDPNVNALGKASLTCSSGQIAKFDGTNWACAADGGGAVDSVNGHTGAVSLTTDDVTQGTSNKYYTPAAPGDIGTTTPGAGTFTTLTATSFNLGEPPTGQTGEISMPEDPANGANVVGFKAPASVPADQLWVLPSVDGTSGQALTTNGSGALSWSTPGGAGDMLKSTYDANADNLIDDAAIASTIARDSEIPTTLPASDVSAWAKAGAKPAYTAAEVGALPDTTTIPTLTSQLTNDSSFLTSYTETNPGAEPALGNPDADGKVLSSTAAGVRSWVAGGGGAVDLTAPGPIGSVTPNTADFTTLTASSFDWGTPANGTTGEIALLGDPAINATSVTLKAPATIPANVVWTLPATDSAGTQALTSNGAGVMSWKTVPDIANNLSEYAATASSARSNLGLEIGSTVQAYDDDLADLADGSLTGSKVGTGISAANVTTGTLPDAVIPATIARDTEMTLAPVAAPTTAADACTAGTWAYASGFVYVCVATDTWQRAALATW